MVCSGQTLWFTGSRSIGFLQRYAASSCPFRQQSWPYYPQGRALHLGTSPVCLAAMRVNHSAAPDIHPQAREVLQFWLGDDFLEAKPNSVPPPEKKKIWFGGGASLDKDMTDKFGSLMKQAADSGLHDWIQKYDALAAVLVFDQFSRNIYRGTSTMYDLDSVARKRARSLLDSNAASLPLIHRLWLLYPFVHSEDPHDQEVCHSAESHDVSCAHLQHSQACR
ncbi:TPA: hypothetical protein ACH3X3_009155 [Trebouxia sp. C0006]